ncbi:MAG: 30S ribosome-binding factor RbfA [Planctomycetes bacterium]|nr:30S ribosome-binding factor RbfA [Planctomycetota bacterium]MCP4770593.1 30S ribosome-binding factor RbfA [Planctomycetota bacterium]MCP4861078.1 30S ribosome-binding factor RbfA [Planctomycetota bacterium]
MASERRQQQVARRIQQKVSELLLHDIRDPRASFVTVTNVTISRDLVKAKVYWSVLEERHKSKVSHMFEHAKGFIRREVAREINIRSAPLLEFFYDEGLVAADRIEQVLREVLPPEERTIGELPAQRDCAASELPPVKLSDSDSAENADDGAESRSPWPVRKDELDD